MTRLASVVALCLALAGAQPAPAPDLDGGAAGRALSVDVAEFADIHDMTDDELRKRFDLPGSCDPALSARHVRGEAVDLAIRCAENEA